MYILLVLRKNTNNNLLPLFTLSTKRSKKANFLSIKVRLCDDPSV